MLAADDRLRAVDRTNALDAGANDFLSDNFSIVELSSRLKRAAQAARGQLSHRKAVADETVSEVEGLMETGANDVLVVRGERERLIPYVPAVVRTVDLEQGTLEVDWDPEY